MQIDFPIKITILDFFLFSCFHNTMRRMNFYIHFLIQLSDIFCFSKINLIFSSFLFFLISLINIVVVVAIIAPKDLFCFLS